MSVFVWFTAWNLYPVFKHLFFFFNFRFFNFRFGLIFSVKAEWTFVEWTSKAKKVFRLFRKPNEFEWSPWARDAYFIHITIGLEWLSFSSGCKCGCRLLTFKERVCFFVSSLGILIGNPLFRTFQPWCSIITHIPFCLFVFLNRLIWWPVLRFNFSVFPIWHLTKKK